MQNQITLTPPARDALTKALDRASRRLDDSLALAQYIVTEPSQHPAEVVALAERILAPSVPAQQEVA